MDAVRKPETDAMCKYVAGYNECVAQVTQYFTSLQTSADGSVGHGDSLPDDARCSLLDHLANSLHHSATPSHVTARPTVDQSSSSSLPPSAVYVISRQQVPVTSSTSPSQLTVMPAALSGGQFVLLLAGSSADQQRGDCPAESSELVKLGNCDGTVLEASDTVFDYTSDQALRDLKTERHDINSQSQSSPVARDQQQNTDDLHMWRPW